MKKFFENLLAIILGLVLVFFVSIIVGWPVMLLWNWLMPAIFGLGTITFWQACGIMWLCGILFNRGNSK